MVEEWRPTEHPRAKLILQELCVATNGAEGQLNIEWVAENIAQARAEALEEAARVAEKYHDWEPMLDGSGIAAAIRALKEPKP